MIEDAGVFRTPKEYLYWFECIIASRRLGEEKKRALLHTGPYKLLYEEVFPTASLLKHKCKAWRFSRFRNVVGSQPYGVEVQDNQLKYLEITCTDFDDGERFRMLRLLECGHVDAAGVVQRDAKGTPVAIDDDMRCADDVVAERADLIAKAILKKSKKAYHQQTGLIVYFDDFSIMLRDRDLGKLIDVVESTRAAWNPAFESVFLVGPRAEVLIEASRVERIVRPDLLPCQSAAVASIARAISRSTPRWATPYLSASRRLLLPSVFCSTFRSTTGGTIWESY
jgi:hypothetical protein